MKMFLKNGLIFVVMTIMSYPLFIIIWGECFFPVLNANSHTKVASSYGHLYSRIHDISNYKDVDILFLGSSHAYRGFDIRIFKKRGYYSFNLGSSHQTPVQTRILLKRYLNYLNPKLIVFEVYPRVFLDKGIESSVDLIANDAINSDVLKMALDYNNIRVYNTIIYASAKHFINSYRKIIEPSIRGEDTYISGGYIEAKMHYNRPILVAHPQKWAPLQENMDAFENIIKEIKQKRIQVVLVQAPVNKSSYEAFNSDNELIDKYYSTISTYYNFNKSLNLSDSLHYIDSGHLNQNGVEIFNNSLIDTLVANGIIKSSGKNSIGYN